MYENLDSLNYRETFLFFYWDIQRYRPEHAKFIDGQILLYLQKQLPSPDSDEDPDSWDQTLHCMMRGLLRQLGSNIHPQHGDGCDYNWLSTRREELQGNRKPYLDWAWLREHIYMRGTDPNPHVWKVIHHMSSEYCRRSVPPTSLLGAWRANVYLQDFSMAHRIPSWSILLPAPQSVFKDIYRSSQVRCGGSGGGSGGCRLSLTSYSRISVAEQSPFFLLLQDSPAWPGYCTATLSVEPPKDHCVHHCDEDDERKASVHYQATINNLK